MVTGIELAGLILAIMPILRTAMHFYRVGFRTLKHVDEYMDELDDLRNAVLRQTVKFENTLEKLLVNTVSPHQLCILLKDPKDRMWHSGDVQKSFADFLHSGYQIFCEALGNFHITVDALRKKFPITRNDLVCTLKPSPFLKLIIVEYSLIKAYGNAS